MSGEKTISERAATVAAKMADSFRKKHAEATAGAPAPGIEWDFWGKKMSEILSDPDIVLDWDLARMSAGQAVLKLKKGQLQDRAHVRIEDLENKHVARVLTTVRAAHERLLRLGPPRPARWEGE